MATNITGSITVGEDDKVRENRLRRIAWRQGYRLVKSRRRDPRAYDYGEIWLLREMVQAETGRWEAVASPEQTHDAWIGPFSGYDEVEAWLTPDDEAA